MEATMKLNLGRFLILILCPIILIILLITIPYSKPANSRGLLQYELRWACVAVLAGVYWMFNSLHIAPTSFIPMVLLPILGITNAKELASHFMCDYNLVTFGSILLMMAADECGFKRRLSLLILKHSWGSIRWIFVDVYLTATWVAMWINSAAAAYFMMQVIDDLLEFLNAEVEIGALGEERMGLINEIQSQKQQASSKKETKSMEAYGKTITQKCNFPQLELKLEESKVDLEASKSEVPDTKPSTAPSTDKEVEKADERSTAATLPGFQAENEQLLNDFGGELLYAAAVAANLGGMLWPFGSPMGYDVRTAIPSLTQASWFIYSLPLLILNSLVAILYLLSVHFGVLKRFLLLEPKKQRLTSCKQSQQTLRTTGEVFSSKFAALPPLNRNEKWLLFVIPATIVLCLTRHPGFISGWATPIQENQFHLTNKTFVLGDSVTYVMIALFLFVIPAWGCQVFKSSTSLDKKEETLTIIGWKKLQSNFPFIVLMVIGGATCLGKFSEKAVAVPLSNHLVERIQKPSNELLTAVMMVITIFFSILMPSPGTSLAVTQLWTNLLANYRNKGILVEEPLLLPVLSVASLCFILPSSSVGTMLVYVYKKRKTLSAWYFLRIGVPLLLCTFPLTLIYALLWTPSSLV